MMVKLFYPPVREWFMEHHFKEFCIFENETFKNSTWKLMKRVKIERENK